MNKSSAMHVDVMIFLLLFTCFFADLFTAVVFPYRRRFFCLAVATVFTI